MQLIDMSDYNWRARICWFAAIIFGALAFGWAVAGVLHFDTQGVVGVAALMGIVYLSGLRPISISGHKILQSLRATSSSSSPGCFTARQPQRWSQQQTRWSERIALHSDGQVGWQALP